MRRSDIARHGILILLVTGLLAATTFLVKFSGGASGAAVNFYYIPIIVSAVAFGDLGAIVCAILAAALCGPFMPWALDIDGHPIRQSWLDIGLRQLFFFVLGVLASRLTDRARKRANEFASLFQVARAVNSSIRLEQVLQLIVKSVYSMMRVKGVAIRLLDESQEDGELRFGHAISEGLSHEYLSKGPVLVDESPIDQRVLAGESIQVPDVEHSELLQYSDALIKEGVHAMVAVPLASRGRAIGVFRLYAGRPHRYRKDEFRLVHAFAEEAALAIENAGLYESLQESYYETVRSLTRALEARDVEEIGHAERVTLTVDDLATEIGLGREEVELLRFGATLHDIGKIGLFDSGYDADDDMAAVLHGGRSRTKGHDELLVLHTIIGRSILEPVKFLSPVLPMVLYHHECYDGSGYPEGLAGEDIPLYARIAKIANDYDVLFRRRGSGQIPGVADVIQHYKDRAGTEYDAELVKAFVRVLKRREDVQG